MDSLKFIETMSVADFKAKMGVEKIDGDGGAPTLATL